MTSSFNVEDARVVPEPASGATTGPVSPAAGRLSTAASSVAKATSPVTGRLSTAASGVAAGASGVLTDPLSPVTGRLSAAPSSVATRASGVLTDPLSLVTGRLSAAPTGLSVGVRGARSALVASRPGMFRASVVTDEPSWVTSPILLPPPLQPANASGAANSARAREHRRSLAISVPFDRRSAADRGTRQNRYFTTDGRVAGFPRPRTSLTNRRPTS